MQVIPEKRNFFDVFKDLEISADCSKNHVFLDFIVYFCHMFVMYTWKIFPHGQEETIFFKIKILKKVKISQKKGFKKVSSLFCLITSVSNPVENVKPVKYLF